MPSPIQLMSEDSHQGLFDLGYDRPSALSVLQDSIFGVFAPSAPVNTDTSARTAAKRVPSRFVPLLEAIWKGGADNTLTVASGYSGGGSTAGSISRAAAPSQYSSAERDLSATYRVPSFIRENDLLELKSEDLVRSSGSARAVTITRLGKEVLSNYWLSSRNDLRENRPKPKFDHAQALREYQGAGRYKKRQASVSQRMEELEPVSHECLSSNDTEGEFWDSEPTQRRRHRKAGKIVRISE